MVKCRHVVHVFPLYSDDGNCVFVFPLYLLSHSPDAVVVHQHSFESPEQRKSVQLSDLIIGKVDGIKLIQSSAEVLQNRDFITCRNMNTGFKIGRRGVTWREKTPAGQPHCVQLIQKTLLNSFIYPSVIP